MPLRAHTPCRARRRASACSPASGSRRGSRRWRSGSPAAGRERRAHFRPRGGGVETPLGRRRQAGLQQTGARHEDECAPWRSSYPGARLTGATASPEQRCRRRRRTPSIRPPPTRKDAPARRPVGRRPGRGAVERAEHEGSDAVGHGGQAGHGALELTLLGGRDPPAHQGRSSPAPAVPTGRRGGCATGITQPGRRQAEPGQAQTAPANRPSSKVRRSPIQAVIRPSSAPGPRPP